MCSEPNAIRKLSLEMASIMQNSASPTSSALCTSRNLISLWIFLFLFYSEHMEYVKLGGVPSPLLMVPYFPFAAYNILTAALTQEYRTMQWFLHLCNHTPQFFYLVKWCIWLSVLVYSIPRDLIFFPEINETTSELSDINWMWNYLAIHCFININQIFKCLR